MLARRKFLALSAWGCAHCLVGGLQAEEAGKHAAQGHPHWAYAGDGKPDVWGELQPDFKVCQLGVEQTPIDLANGFSGEPGKLDLRYIPTSLRILNNGHTIQVNPEAGSYCVIGNARYELVQFHFHHPSEHLLAGRRYEMECHFVHKAANGALAVVGVFITPGASHPHLAAIFDAMPSASGPEVRVAQMFNPAMLIPSAASYFRYMGSLTTPPCSEGLTWTVFREPIQAAPEELQKFAALYPNNARPVQRRNNRLLVEVN